MKKRNKMSKKIDTLCVQAGYEPKSGEPRVLPLYLSTTYKYDSAKDLEELFNLQKVGHIYSRISNPTVAAFEEKIALLEGGVAAIATSSGISASTLAILNVCQSGDNIVCASEIYGGTYNLFNVSLRKLGIDTRFFALDEEEDDIEKLIDDKTKMIYIETIANPTVIIADLEKFAKIAKKHKLLLVVDNTLATPYLVNPIKYGADIIIHSSTKYLDGHASAVGGVLVDSGKFDFKDNPRYEDFNTPDESYHGLVYTKDAPDCPFAVKARVQGIRDYGMVMSPMNAYLSNLGAETLHLRMQRHSQNALALAKALEHHEKIESVKYPGLEKDEEHKKLKKYFKDSHASGMLSIKIKTDKEGVFRFIDSVKLFKIVTHIADSRSCLLHPASTTHRQLSDEQLKEAKISSNLVRLSVGIEDEQDIIEDILTALDKV